MAHGECMFLHSEIKVVKCIQCVVVPVLMCLAQRKHVHGVPAFIHLRGTVGLSLHMVKVHT